MLKSMSFVLQFIALMLLRASAQNFGRIRLGLLDLRMDYIAEDFRSPSVSPYVTLATVLVTDVGGEDLLRQNVVTPQAGELLRGILI